MFQRFHIIVFEDGDLGARDTSSKNYRSVVVLITDYATVLQNSKSGRLFKCVGFQGEWLGAILRSRNKHSILHSLHKVLVGSDAKVGKLREKLNN